MRQLWHALILTALTAFLASALYAHDIPAIKKELNRLTAKKILIEQKIKSRTATVSEESSLPGIKEQIQGAEEIIKSHAPKPKKK